MEVLIFANGDLAETFQLTTLINRVDAVYAADGGANHCSNLNITPDILIGDLDSIDASILLRYEDSGVEIYRHPTRKDATDLEISLDLALSRGVQKIWLAGVLGGRWDMSLANIFLAAAEKYRCMHIGILAPDCSIHILHPSLEPFIVDSSLGENVSLLPLRNDIHGLTLKGFEYPLSKQTVEFGSSRGVSNLLRGKQASIDHTKGILLCVQFADN
ncbi:MAG: thiamine diphosphokinase [Deltaproteobacteria bacterium]|nr:thiamine diphosphokinase [Deltaproteobacteria bacterium]